MSSSNNRYRPRPARREASASRSTLVTVHSRDQMRRAREERARRERRRRALTVCGILAAVVVLVVLAFGLHHCTSGSFQDAYELTDQEGQASLAQGDVSQEDSTDIVLTLQGDVDTYVLAGEEYLESSCHAIDNNEGDITASLVTQGEVDTSTPGDYTVTYTATNSQGASASVVRTVHVVEAMEKQETGIPIMMYHYVYTANDVPEMSEDSKDNYMLDSVLEEEIAYLVENDYYFPSWLEVRSFIQGSHTLPKNSVVLTFDDGQKGFLKYGIPILEKYQVPATSFIICNQESASSKIIEYASPYVSFQSHSFAMHQDGSDYGTRGIMGGMSKDEIVADLKKAQDILGTSEAFAYPYGYTTDEAVEAMDEAGILVALVIKNDWARIGDDVRALPRVRVYGDMSLESFAYVCQHTVQ